MWDDILRSNLAEAVPVLDLPVYLPLYYLAPVAHRKRRVKHQFRFKRIDHDTSNS